MGGGGLRILPHKKWHVWRRDNIERVLRDEREQEEKQQQQDEKQRRLDQERRAQQLTTERDAPCPQEHVNLFQIEETLAKNSKKKKDGADTLKRHGQLPWYAKGNEAKQPTDRQERKRKRELEEKDPLRHMRPKERKAERDEEAFGASDHRRYSARYDRSTERDRSEDGGRPKKRRKHKKEKLMQELRREREEREAAERRRAERLMHG